MTIPATLTLAAVVGPLGGGCAWAAAGGLDTVVWAPDTTADGTGTGTLDGNTITYTTAGGFSSAGETIAVDWNALAGSDNAVGTGVSSPTGGLLGQSGTTTQQTQTITFTEAVTNPTLLFAFGDPGTAFDFGPHPITLLDANNATAAGSVVTFTSGAGNNGFDGFAVRVAGTFGPGAPLTFTYLNNTGGFPVTAAFTVGATHALDLAISDSTGVAVNRGDAFTYTLTGAVDPTGATETVGSTLTLEQTLPTGVAPTATPTGTGWTCTTAGTPVVVSCTFPVTSDLAPGTLLPPITVPVSVTGTAAGPLTSTGSLTDGIATAAASNTITVITPAAPGTQGPQGPQGPEGPEGPPGPPGRPFFPHHHHHHRHHHHWHHRAWDEQAAAPATSAPATSAPDAVPPPQAPRDSGG